MLAERKEDYNYEYDDGYHYGEMPYESSQVPIAAPQVRKRKHLKSPTVLDTNLRSRARVLFLLVAALAMIVVVRSGISASRGYALVAVQQQAQQLEQENERLRIEIATLKSPQRIKAIATEELGMEVPKKMYFTHER